MPQSNVIFAYLLAAFVIFIAQRGQLRRYMGFLAGRSSATPAPEPTEKSSDSGGGVGDAIKTGAKFLPYILG